MVWPYEEEQRLGTLRMAIERGLLKESKKFKEVFTPSNLFPPSPHFPFLPLPPSSHHPGAPRLNECNILLSLFPRVFTFCIFEFILLRILVWVLALKLLRQIISTNRFQLRIPYFFRHSTEVFILIAL